MSVEVYLMLMFTWFGVYSISQIFYCNINGNGIKNLFTPISFIAYVQSEIITTILFIRTK